MAQDKIIVRGAKEHNLKNVNVEIPRNKLVVITGLVVQLLLDIGRQRHFPEGVQFFIQRRSIVKKFRMLVAAVSYTHLQEWCSSILTFSRI